MVCQTVNVPNDVRTRLIDAAAQMITDQGPAGLSTRKLAAAADTSTQSVYTHFGNIHGLVSAVVDEGFTRLSDHMASVERTDQPLADLAQLGEAYRKNALANPNLYGVMFGTVSLGKYRRTGAELSRGRSTFDILAAAVQRCIDAGQLEHEDAERAAAQLWSALHGYLMLELAGFMTDQDGSADEVLWPMMSKLVTAQDRSPG